MIQSSASSNQTLHIKRLTKKSLFLGCWGFEDSYWPNHTSDENRQLIQEALRQGIFHFDSAIAYGNGGSEQFLSSQLRHYLKSLDKSKKISTQNNLLIDSKSILKNNQDIKVDLQASLKRMNLNKLNTYYIHYPNPKIHPANAIESLTYCKEEGLIEKIGVSNFSLTQLMQAQQGGSIDCIQNGFNLLWRDDEKELIPYCKENKITFNGYSPLAQGLLTGKYRKTLSEYHNGATRHLILFQANCWNKLYPEIQLLKKEIHALKCEWSLAQLSIAWLIHNSPIDNITLGAKNKKQLLENIKAWNIPKSEPALEIVHHFSKRVQKIIPKAKNLFNH